MKIGIIGIYRILNIITGKVYIGKSFDIKRRWRQHRNLNLNGYHLQRSIKKYGLENFDFSLIIEMAPMHDIQQQLNILNALERTWIRIYESNNPQKGYNETAGGDGIIGFRFNERSIQQIKESWAKRTFEQNKIFKEAHNTSKAKENHSKANKANWEKMSLEKKEKIRQASINKVFSEEGLKSLRQYAKNRKGKDSESTRFKKGSAFRGKHLSEEHKTHIGESNKGKTGWKHTDEQKEEQRKKIMGIKRSELTRAKHRKENLSLETLALLGSGARGKNWYNNGTINKPFTKEDQIPDGWIKGRLIKKRRTKAEMAISPY
jgi:group I intron endonuclease